MFDVLWAIEDRGHPHPHRSHVVSDRNGRQVVHDCCDIELTKALVRAALDV